MMYTFCTTVHDNASHLGISWVIVWKFLGEGYNDAPVHTVLELYHHSMRITNKQEWVTVWTKKIYAQVTLFECIINNVYLHFEFVYASHNMIKSSVAKQNCKEDMEAMVYFLPGLPYLI